MLIRNYFMIYLPPINENRLLNLLLINSSKSFSSNLKLVHLVESETLLEKGQQVTHSYFPTNAVISLTFESTEKMWLEIEAIRNDGMFGLPSMIDIPFSCHATVQSSGYAYKIETSVLEEETESSEVLKNLLRYQQLRVGKISQISVCSRFHTVEQQYCRILLTIMDHLYSNVIDVTHQTIATKLNVRRESISLCAANLQRKGIVNTLRGKVVVLNREKLEERACECYKVINDAKN